MTTPRVYTPEELESVRMTELLVDRRPPEQKAAETSLQPREGQVKLYHPGFEGLKFGPGSGPETHRELIVFGMVEPHVAIVDADHPLLPALLKQEPGVVVLRPGEIPGRTYACETCDGEFPSKATLSAHRREAHTRKKAAATTDDGA